MSTFRIVPCTRGRYEIDEAGRLRRRDSGETLKVSTIVRHIGGKDYHIYVYGVIVDGKSTQRTPAALVALAFLGEEPEGHTLKYKDGNNANWHLSNLEYAPKKKEKNAMKRTLVEGSRRVLVATNSDASCTDCFKFIKSGEVYTQEVRRLYKNKPDMLIVARICKSCRPVRAEEAENL